MPKKILDVRGAIAELQKKRKANLKEAGKERSQKARQVTEILNKLWSVKDKVFKLKKKNEPKGIARYMQALAANIAGEDLQTAALAHGLSRASLANFKTRFFTADAGMAQFMEEVFLKCSFESTQIFLAKKDQMSGPQAAITAGVFADKFLAMKKARQSEYKDTSSDVALEVLQRMENITSKIANIKQAKARIVEPLTIDEGKK